MKLLKCCLHGAKQQISYSERFLIVKHKSWRWQAQICPILRIFITYIKTDYVLLEPLCMLSKLDLWHYNVIIPLIVIKWNYES